MQTKTYGITDQRLFNTLFFLFVVGWDRVHFVLRPLLVYCTSPKWWRWMWSNWWIEDWQEKPKYCDKTCPSATLSITNPTWYDPGSNPGLRGGKPATNRLSYGKASNSHLTEIYLWLYNPCVPWPRNFLIYAQSVGLLGRGISPSQGRYINTEQHKHRINAQGHPCLEWDSNPRFQCTSGRRRFMPLKAWPLWPAFNCNPIY
jgi:hypothetical protein